MELKVPLALDEQGSEVYPEQAQPGKIYLCASCQGKVYLRRGTRRRAHFVHYSNPEHCDFIYETEAHLRAKWAIKAAVDSGVTPFVFLRSCKGGCGEVVKQHFPTGIQAVLEYMLPSGHRADVALLNPDGSVRAIIEVLETHAVDEDKRKALQPYYWAEIEAQVILEKQEWPLKQDYFIPYICSRCQQVKRYGVRYPFAGETKQYVACPILGRGLVNVINDCTCCEYFVDIHKSGIFCIGAVTKSEARG